MERSKIQKLYEACAWLFSEKQPPSFQQIQWLASILDTIEAKDVGIDEFSKQQSELSSTTDSSLGLIRGRNVVPTITYIHIHECDDFSIGVFCFPAGGTLPLHDHPGMTVLSKVLYGSLYIKAYDWLMGSSCYETVGLASTAVDGVFEAPCKASVLFPRSGGNIHSLASLTPCAILDVLSPPYSDELGRPSTYYSHTPIPSLPGCVILTETDLPDDLIVNGAPYLGPQIITSIHIC